MFRDPVHRLVRIDRVDQFILDLINTPEVQRLRRVRQLGVSSLTYHGAEHSRFSHSLGVFNFSQRIISALCRRYGNDHRVSQLLIEHSRVIKAAALLHDLGHGPFSHMLENVKSLKFSHERVTSKLILNSRVSEVLKSHNIKPDEVSAVISGTYPFRLAVDIVSSQLDADRMDYLLRDSLMTGVEYGVYDAEWLLNAMCVGKDPGSSTTPLDVENSWRLCIDRDRGLHSAEQLILARHHMMLQVYMHRVTRGYEIMLLGLFTHLAQLAKQNSLPASTPSVISKYFVGGVDALGADWLHFDESSLVSAIQGWASNTDPGFEAFAEAARAFLNRERLFFGARLATRLQDIRDLSNGLTEKGLVEWQDWALDNGEHLPYKGVYYGGSVGSAEEEEQSTLSILVSSGDPDQKGKAVEHDSTILKNLDNQAQGIRRLYVKRSRVSEAKPVLDRFNIKI